MSDAEAVPPTVPESLGILSEVERLCDLALEDMRTKSGTTIY